MWIDNILDNNRIYESFRRYYNAVPNITDTTRIVTYDVNGVTVPLIRFKIFEEYDFIRQGFSTRAGGVSEGIYSSMNLTYGLDDSRDNVAKNFNIIGSALGIEPAYMVYSKQTHTTNVHKVDAAYRGVGVVRPHMYDDVDGLVTDEAGVCLVTAYADCIPVIVADVKKKVIGAAHAGWRGTAGNIVCNMIELMKTAYGSDTRDMKAFVGPGICIDCYEVSEDVAESFMRLYSKDECDLIMERGKPEGKYQLNLPMANVINLVRSGLSLSDIAVSDICTCCNPDILFSHRASGGRRGILCNFIMINE